MPSWRDGLVDAFPIPEDDKPQKPETEEINNVASELGALSLQSTIPPFPFFDLPPELRNRVYDLVLFSKPGYRGASGRRKGSRLATMLVDKRMHNEAAYVLYTTYRFKIFPIQVFTPLPTISELPTKYRMMVSTLEMTVGASWTSPPKVWRVTKALGKILSNLQAVQTLRVFVEFDPSIPVFKSYRISDDFYTDFCGDLLEDVLEVMPQLKYVELDGNPGVDVHGPLVTRLREEALEQDKIIKWGKEGKWAYKV